MCRIKPGSDEKSVSINRLTVSNVNYTFSEELRTGSATGTLFVQFIRVTPGSVWGLPIGQIILVL